MLLIEFGTGVQDTLFDLTCRNCSKDRLMIIETLNQEWST
jgi:hypothetical protein